MIDKGFRILKLVLLGIIIVAIPFLFIMQAEKNENERKEKEAAQQKAIQAEAQILKSQAELQYKNDIIKFYSDAMTSKGINDTLRKKITIQVPIFDTVRYFIFDKSTNRLIIQFDGSYINNNTGGTYQTVPINDTNALYIRKLCEDYFNRK